MCGRFSLQTPVPDLAELFEADPSRLGEWSPRYNMAPTDEVIALRRRAEGRELVPLRWGLIPNWAEDPGSLPLMINARSESLETRRAFRDLILDRRCAVLADGFYEWRTEGGVKQPYFVRRRDGTPMALAGLWDIWRGPDGPVGSCTIVTTDANDLLEPLHDRMPVILEGEGAQMWLDLDISELTMEPLKPFRRGGARGVRGQRPGQPRGRGRPGLHRAARRADPRGGGLGTAPPARRGAAGPARALLCLACISPGAACGLRPSGRSSSLRRPVAHSPTKARAPERRSRIRIRLRSRCR